MKKLFLSLLILLLTACSSSLSELPKPEIESGIRGEQLGIDKNINEKTIDNYLNRSDSVYRDMRMLKDEANYEAIGGDSNLSGYIKGFEIVSLPYLCNVTGLPQEVGSTYEGATLFTLNDDGTYKENYEESLSILNELFPKDKTIFLMCGGGGYAGKTKKLLVYYGYDENKIYNTGGFWYYEGPNSISTRKDDGTYDFNEVPYHKISFDNLTPKDGYDPSKIIDVKPRENKLEKIEELEKLQSLIENKETFGLLVTLEGCTTCAAFRPIVEEYENNSDLKIYEVSIPLVEEYLGIKYTPTILIYKDGEMLDMLDPNSDEDIKYYDSLDGLSEWVNHQ